MESGQRQFVLFRLQREEYGVPIEKVRSIIRYEQPTPVPKAPEAVEGVINLRGQVIPVVDLGRRLLGQPFVAGPASRIIVTEGVAGLAGLLVDAAQEVSTIAYGDIRPAPDSVLTRDTADAFEGVAAWDERLVILLDLDHALPKAGLGPLPGEEGDSDV